MTAKPLPFIADSRTRFIARPGYLGHPGLDVITDAGLGQRLFLHPVRHHDDRNRLRCWLRYRLVDGRWCADTWLHAVRRRPNSHRGTATDRLARECAPIKKPPLVLA